VENEVVSTPPPAWNGPLLARAQANTLSGPAESVDVDTSETGSPVAGTDGNHLNEAAGGACTGTGGGVTVNVAGGLRPAGFPNELSCDAIAVYCPADRGGVALPEVQAPPVPVAVAAETIAPFVVAPMWIWTVTGLVSLAVPVKDGVALLDGDLGEFNVTVGAAVFTVNVTGELVPVSDARVCEASAV
jgi:hypothetical protein